MRTSPVLLALPALSLAQQFPLFDQIKSYADQATAVILSAASVYMPGSVPTSAAEAVNAAAAKVSSPFVQDLTLANWKDVVSTSATSTSAGPEEWLVYITGGNKTCYGTCGNTTAAWNVCIY